MIFTPTLKRKRISSIKTTDPLPQCPPDQQATGVFTGFSVELSNPEHIRTLYDSGCFGKGSKSRSCPEFIKRTALSDVPDCSLSENLVLDLEETFFLAQYLKILKVENIEGTTLNAEELLSEFSKIKSDFVDNLVAYLYLRSKNWIVKSGTKFGANFLIYKKGPRFFHASFIVLVNREETLLPRDLKGLQRIAETSDKDVLFLEISPPSDCDAVIQNLHKFKVSENIIKRFNYSAFVQTK